MGGIIYNIYLRLTDDNQERCSAFFGSLAFLGLGIYSLIRSSQDFSSCGNDIPNLNYFTVTFSVLSIVFAISRLVMAIERHMKGLDDFSLTGKVCYATIGITLVGLAGWGSALSFGKETPLGSCGDLFTVAKTQCIITWIMFGLALLRMSRKFGIIKVEAEDENQKVDKNSNNLEESLISENV